MNKNIRLICWMVVRDDEYYIDMAIESVLPYVDGIYILDNGSTDGTIKKIESFNNSKIYLEKIKYSFERPDFAKGDHTWTHPYWQWDERYDGNSLEAQTRNLCMKHCIEKFDPDWLIQLDADEVYTPLFFKKLNELELEKIAAIRHSTDCFLNETTIMRRPNGDTFDCHYRSWNPRLDFKWKKTDKYAGHVAIDIKPIKGYQILFLKELVHIHLHRTFGPKGISKEEREKLLKGHVKKVNFNWEEELPFVIQKWRKWRDEQK